MSIELTQSPAAPSAADFDRLPHWLILLPATAAESWPGGPYTEVLRQRWQRRHGEEVSGKILYLELPNPAGSAVAVLGTPARASAFQRLDFGRQVFDLLTEARPQRLGLWLAGLEPAQQGEWAEAVVSAVLAASVALPSYKTKPDPAPRLEALELFGLGQSYDFARCQAIHAGNYLARSLSVLPPNQLNPKQYRERIAEIAREHGWGFEFYDQARLEQEGAGAFLAVVQGSPDAEAGIVRLRYTPPTPGGKTLALVGKGLCFDTGGYQLKTAKGMQQMHEDMQGSAVALGTLLALSRLRVDFSVDCWLALAENHIGPRAYKPHDVITAADGTRIEVMHTDAEGRLVLADTLVFASRERPDLIVDYATLTGSCITALGTRYSGVLSNREALLPRLTEAGRASGERVWPFPLDSDYDDDLDSDIADIKQCLLDSDADHIYAARLLQRFVAGLPWVHLDLGASHRDDGLAHIPTPTTGFGVRYSVYLLLEGGAWD